MSDRYFTGREIALKLGAALGIDLTHCRGIALRCYVDEVALVTVERIAAMPNGEEPKFEFDQCELTRKA